MTIAEAAQPNKVFDMTTKLIKCSALLELAVIVLYAFQRMSVRHRQGKSSLARATCPEPP